MVQAATGLTANHVGENHAFGDNHRNVASACGVTCVAIPAQRQQPCPHRDQGLNRVYSDLPL